MTISDHPLDKIFEDIPARSEDSIHVSVRQYLLVLSSTTLFSRMGKPALSSFLLTENHL
jgi:hypothetical protein